MNVFYDLQSREYVASYRNTHYRDNREYPLSFVRTMSPLVELVGHGGCVNRLDWNEAGNLLASGSDDTTVKIWRPFEYYYLPQSKQRPIADIHTEHHHNLFGVRFIPGTNDRFLCTGSMDKLVQIQSVDRQRTIKNYELHSDRVKDVQVTPRHPFIFYSVSEDGTIRRFDIRVHYKQFVQVPSPAASPAAAAAANGTHLHSLRHNGAKIKSLFQKAKDHISENFHNINDKLHRSNNGNIVIKLDFHPPPITATNNNHNTFSVNFHHGDEQSEPQQAASSSSPPPSSSTTSPRINPNSSQSQSLSPPPTSLPELLQAIRRREAARGRRTINRINNRFRRRTDADSNHDSDDDDDDDDDDDEAADGRKRRDDDHKDMEEEDDEEEVDSDGFPIESDSEDFSRYNIEETEELTERCMLKGLSINPVRDYEFAIACGDQYVRVFDIRKGNELTWKECMSWVAPPHLSKHSKLYQRNVTRNFGENLATSIGNIHTTFVEYSPDGAQMVVTYHGENVYVFNTKSYDESHPLDMYLHSERDDIDIDIDMEAERHVLNKQLMQQIEMLKKMGNDCYNCKQYSKAIEFYQKAINCIDQSYFNTKTHSKVAKRSRLPLHVLYCNLAMCLFQRMHFNDLMMALFYADKAIELDADYVKAYFWKIKIAAKLSDDKLTLLTVKKAHHRFPDNVRISKEYAKITSKLMKPKASKKQNDENAVDGAESKQLANSAPIKLETINEENEEHNKAVTKESNGKRKKSKHRNRQKQSKIDETETVFISKESRRLGRNFEYEFYQRYTGHCNLKTDIKEATFFGDKYICSGSDDGRCFIWDKESGKLVNILSDVDEEVVNTVRKHPYFPVLAMSGIDSTIKIWQPSCVASTQYCHSHKIPFYNPSSELNSNHHNKWKHGSNEKVMHCKASSSSSNGMQSKTTMETDSKVKKSKNKTLKIRLNQNHSNNNDDAKSELDEFAVAELDGDMEFDCNAMSETRMNQVIQENQDNLSNPPSQQIDLSTLLFWANLMNQQ